MNSRILIIAASVLSQGGVQAYADTLYIRSQFYDDKQYTFLSTMAKIDADQTINREGINPNKSGEYVAKAIPVNERVIVDESLDENNIIIMDLGTLTADNSGYSYANAISADGRVVTGSAMTDDGSIHAFRYNEADGKKTDLGTLAADNSGYSYARAISADGQVVAGDAMTDDGSIHAFRYNEGDTRMTDLGTLRADNAGYSIATAISADGRVIVGYASVNDSDERHAYRHNKDDTKMTDLGTLRTDNSGTSLASAISADGSVVAGTANTDNGTSHAFRHNEDDTKMTDLGTLAADNSGNSSAAAISADGRVVVGTANTDSGTSRAFRHNKDDTKMTDLGTLAADNSGNSSAAAISADGSVVAGTANTDNGTSHAFRHNEDDTKMTDLGTLAADNSGNSSAAAISADGRVVVGTANTDNGTSHAFRHNEGDAKMTDLGTLRADNSGNSSADAISADGQVILGTADNDFGVTRAVIWKSPRAVDINNTYNAMDKTAHKVFGVLDLYQNTLLQLTDSHCQLSEDNYCLGGYSRYNNVRQNSNLTAGLYGAVRLPSEKWIVGGSINLANDTDLVKNYQARGNTLPGIGLFTRYQANKDNTGLSVELAGAYIKNNLSIKREKLNGTEQGKGNTQIKGYMGKLTAGYGINLQPQTQLTPLIGIQHYKIKRNGYNEHSGADFLASYETLNTTSTDLQLGLNLKHAFTPEISTEIEIGSLLNLTNQRDDFKSSIEYMGKQTYKATQLAHTRPYASVRANYALTKNTMISANIGWSQTPYAKDASTIGISYSYHW